MPRVRCGRFYGFDGSIDREEASSLDLKGFLLGKTPQYAPDRSFDTLHIRLDLDIDFRSRSVRGVCRTTLRSFQEELRLARFDAAEMRILGCRMDGKPCRFTHKQKKLVVRLPRTLSSGEEATLEVRYVLRSPRAGLHFVPSNPKARAAQVWSQGQPEESRYWFPCHDAPHEKASSEIRATVPKGFTAVSNGVLVESSTDPKRGKTTFHWRMDHPHSVYLIALACGRFSEIVEHWEDVPVLYYCEKGREEDAKRGFAKTVGAMDFFSKKTGVRYPYPKYAQIAAGEFPGGMENTTATIQTEAALIDRRASLDTDVDYLVAHELAHQWFGDLVTCRDWSHAWLNEGAATYFEALFLKHDKGPDEFHHEMRQYQRSYFREDEKRYRRPIVCSTYKDPWVLFDRHLYEKGAWVLHMLHELLGDDLWWRCIRHYLTKHRHQNVETTDFITAIEEASGRNLRAFFNDWVLGVGYPAYRVRYRWEPAGRRACLWVQKTGTGDDGSNRFALPVDFRFTGRGWEKRFTEKVSKKEHHFAWRLPGEPSFIEVDPDGKILKKLDFRKPYAMSLQQLRRAKSALSRALAAREVAEGNPRLAVRALSEALRREPFWGAASEMVAALGSIRTGEAFLALRGFLSRARHPKVRRAAVETLSHFHFPEAEALASKYLRSDPSIHVQAEAARTLGKLHSKKAVRLLRPNLRKHSYWDVIRGGAIQGLASTRDLAALPVLEKLTGPATSYPARAYAVRALGEFTQASDRVVPRFLSLLKDPDDRIVLAALSQLGEAQDERALKPLEELKARAANERIVTYADEALGRIRAGIEPSGKPARPKR